MAENEFRKQDALAEMYKEMCREIAEFRGSAMRLLFGLSAFTLAGVSWFVTLDKNKLTSSQTVLIILGLLCLYGGAFIINFALHNYFRKALHGLCNIEIAFYAFEKGFYIKDETLLWPDWEESNHKTE